MKRRIPCSIPACLTGVLSTVRTAAITEEYCSSADSSGFVTLDTSISHSSVSTTRDSPTYQDVLEMFSIGGFVYHKVSVCSLEWSVALSSTRRVWPGDHLPSYVIQVDFEEAASSSASLDADGRPLLDDYLCIWLDNYAERWPGVSNDAQHQE